MMTEQEPEQELEQTETHKMIELTKLFGDSIKDYISFEKLFDIPVYPHFIHLFKIKEESEMKIKIMDSFKNLFLKSKSFIDLFSDLLIKLVNLYGSEKYIYQDKYKLCFHNGVYYFVDKDNYKNGLVTFFGTLKMKRECPILKKEVEASYTGFCINGEFDNIGILDYGPYTYYIYKKPNKLTLGHIILKDKYKIPKYKYFINSYTGYINDNYRPEYFGHMKWKHRYYIGGINNGVESGFGHCNDTIYKFKYYGEMKNTKFNGWGILEQDDYCRRNCKPLNCDCHKYKIMDIGPKEGWFEEGDFKFEIKLDYNCTRCDENNQTNWISKAWNCICDDCKDYYHDNPIQKYKKYKYYPCNSIFNYRNESDFIYPNNYNLDVVIESQIIHPHKLKDILDTVDETLTEDISVTKGYSRKTKIYKEANEAKHIVELSIRVYKQTEISAKEYYQSLFESLLLNTKKSGLFRHF